MVGGTKFGMSGGFTLIEISIVLAIISGLLIVAFVGQGQLRSKARFTDTVDRTVSALADARNKANVTQNSREIGGGTDIDKVFFGILAEFEEDNPVVTFRSFWTDEDACPPGSISEEVSQKNEFELPWGAEPINYNQAVMFGRKCTDGRPVAYILEPDTLAGQLNELGTYTAASTDEPAIIQLSDGADHCANIIVEPVSGNISKEYVPC